MNQFPNVTTMDALQYLGFLPSRSTYNGGGLAYKFGGCELDAFPPDFTRRVAFVASVEGTVRGDNYDERFRVN